MGEPDAKRARTDPVTITKIRCIKTAPGGIRLVVVKVETSRPGLYGLGCATFTQRPSCVVEAVETYLDPFLRGRNVSEIEDIFLASQVSSYWRNGPVLNNALSGVDMALWDIKGKMAGMPVYELLGGKCRKAAPVYVHANGGDIAETIKDARKWMKQGFKHVRLQCAVKGQASYGSGKQMDAVSANTVDGPTSPKSYFDHEAYMRLAPELFAEARKELGDEIELVHDVHERLPASNAVRLAKALEPYRLFFLEDALPPEELDHFRVIRHHTTTPIAVGELFTNQAEYLPLIKDRLIDFLRVHMSDIGGITPMRKIAHLCGFFGVRLAMHGPGDCSPVGMSAMVAIDLSSMSFGIQEWQMDQHGPESEGKYCKQMREVFSGMCEVRDGMVWATEMPGLGIDIDEEAAARYPWDPNVASGANPCIWPAVRRPDGSVVRP